MQVFRGKWNDSNRPQSAVSNGLQNKIRSLASGFIDRKETKIQPQANEQLFRTIFEQANVGVALIETASGQFFRINRKFSELLGYSVDELKTLNFSCLYHAEDGQDHAEELKRLIAGTIDAFALRKHCICKNGELIWLELNVSQAWQKDETPLFYTAIVQDIKDRIASDLALTEGNERFQTLVQTLPQLIWTGHSDGSLDYVNERWIEYTGINRQDISIERNKALIHFEDYDACMTPWLNSVATGCPYEAEYRMKRKDGHYRWHLVRATPMLDSGGKVARWIGSSTDIHEQKSGEQALIEDGYRLNLALDAAQLGTWELDILNGMLRSSHRLVEIFGFEFGASASLVKMRSLIHPEDFEEDMAKIQLAIKLDVPYDSEFRITLGGKITRWVTNHGRVVYDSDSRPLRIIGVTEDITDRKQQELNLQSINTTLEQRVAERTLDAENRAIELARSNSELEQFAYVASHDLQEPLRAVASYVGLLARRYKGQLDKKADDYIQHAVDGATRMQGFINDLLAYSRIRGDVDSRKTVEVSKIFAEVLSDLKNQIDSNQAEISYDDKLPNILGFPEFFRQVLLNLLANALKFRSELQPKVHVSVRRIDNFWEFCVADNGIGIDQKYHSRIFVIFQRLHTREKYEGTGLGLAICKKVVEFHGGNIWVESSAGLGSRFFFTIPVRKDIP